MQIPSPEEPSAQSCHMSAQEYPAASEQQTTTADVNTQLPNVDEATSGSGHDDARLGPSSSRESRLSTGGYPHWNANYIPQSSSSRGARHVSPTELVAGANSPEELLRRLSVSEETPSQSSFASFNSSTSYPGLELSGNVISATFCVPYKIGYADNGKWVLNSRRGTSALFDSFSYLASSESPWNHTLVGWTGEIDQVHPGSGGQGTIRPRNRQSAPIPTSVRYQSMPNEAPKVQVSRKDRQSLEEELEKDHGGRVIPVWLKDEQDDEDVFNLQQQDKWRRYGEHELFTLFHYKQNEPSDGLAAKKAYANYQKMNEAFAKAIAKVYTPGDIVLIHDYHLLLLPSMLRKLIPNIYVGFFLHIPFPSSEYYRSLTRRKEILQGVLGSSMIGFQAFSYSRHFASCCSRILGLESDNAGVDVDGAHVAFDVFPIGIDATRTLRSAFNSPDIESTMERLRQLYAGKKIIVGRDRLDSVRGVAQKLQAFEIFLERYPDWHGQVVLIQVTSPTSIEDREEKSDKTANKISDLVTRINGNFGSLSFTPVHHYTQYLSKEEYFALLRIADLGLITSVRDGMNTTALEYVLCQRDNHGPLIISEFSGTAATLGDAIHINPWDLSGVAKAIDSALTMSKAAMEQSHERLFNAVTKNSVQSWTNKYLRRLFTNLASAKHLPCTPILDSNKLSEQYHKSSRRLFMFDYDGTLTPIVKDPDAAIPTDKVIRTIKTLASDPRNSVWIISGRDQKFLDEWMGHISALGLSAEHGSFIRMPNSAQWENLTESLDMSWQDEVMNIFQRATETIRGSFIERKKIALTWHYRGADPAQGKPMAQEYKRFLQEQVTPHWDVEVMDGKKNLEVRPRSMNKGEIAKRLVAAYGDSDDVAPDFVLCLGDDFTDEDMFRSLQEGTLNPDHVFAVSVGASNKETLATWHLPQPKDVIEALISLVSPGKAAGSTIATAVIEGEIR